MKALGPFEFQIFPRTNIGRLVTVGAATLILVLSSIVSGATPVHAQATSAGTSIQKTPRASLSGQSMLDYFNPSKNPLLSGLQYVADSKPDEQPTSVPDRGTLCKLYGNGSGFATACLQPDGAFVIYETDPGSGTLVARNTNSTDIAVSPTGSTANLDQAVAGVPPPASACGIDNLGECFKDALLWFVKQVALLLLAFATALVGIGGLALNWVINITVLQFGNIIGNNPGLLAAWGVLRDIGNIMLLFGFIFMGISTILNLPGNEFTARRALPTLIIFAILMNFSLFAAEAVIDVSNAFSTTFYKQATSNACPSGAESSECATNFGIGSAIMSTSGISGIWDSKTIELQNTDKFADIVIILGLVLFALVAAFVFFAAVVMFIVRMVVLAFIMVTSPIGFAGMAIPPLQEMARTWWKTLLKQSFFAPVYILMVLISIKFMQGVTTAIGGGVSQATLAGVFSVNGASNISIFIIFLLLMGFLLAAVKIAIDMGAAGAGFATKFAGTATIGATAFVGRRTVGRASLGASQAIRGSGLANTTVGRSLLKATNYGAKATYDARGVSAVKGGLKSAGIDAGNVRKEVQHGYEGIVEEKGKELKKHAESLTLNKSDRHHQLDLRVQNKKLSEDIENLEARRAAADRAGDGIERDRLAAEKRGLEDQKRQKQIEINDLNKKLFARREDFANRLDNDIWSKTVGRVTGSRQFNEEGVHEIRDWLAESPQARLLRQMKAANPPEPAAAAPAPAAGGGGGPAPAAH